MTSLLKEGVSAVGALPRNILGLWLRCLGKQKRAAEKRGTLETDDSAAPIQGDVSLTTTNNLVVGRSRISRHYRKS